MNMMERNAKKMHNMNKVSTAGENRYMAQHFDVRTTAETLFDSKKFR
jgi:hypothetical protein